MHRRLLLRPPPRPSHVAVTAIGDPCPLRGAWRSRGGCGAWGGCGKRLNKREIGSGFDLMEVEARRREGGGTARRLGRRDGGEGRGGGGQRR